MKEKSCSDSEDTGSSACSDTDSEERGGQANSRKPTTDLEVDKKVSQGLPPVPSFGSLRHRPSRGSLLQDL